MTAAPGLLMVGNFVPVGGASPAVSQELSRRLASAGWRVVTTSATRPRPLRLADMLLTTWAARRDYQVAHIDLFSDKAFLWAEATSTLVRRLGKPYVLTLRGGQLPEFSARYPRRTRRVLAGAVAVTAPSHFLREHMAPFRPDIRVIPNPVDLERFAGPPRTRVAGRMVWVRALHARYNPVMAVEVLHHLRDLPETSLLMVGPDKGDGARQAVLEAAERYGLAGRVTLTGAVPPEEVPARLATGDVFLNTTNVDNTPASVLQAMASGLPVVSTRVGGIPFLVEHDVDVLLVPPGDAAAMARAVRRLVTEPDLVGRLTAAAARKVAAFDWGRVVAQWDELLGAIARRSAAQAPG